MSQIKTKVSIHPLFFACLALMIVTNNTLYMLALLSAIALHECGHLLIYRWFRVPVARIALQPFAIRIEPSERIISHKVQLLCAFFGPMVNLISATITYFIVLQVTNEWLSVFYQSSLFLGVFNILPMLPLDGGRVLVIVSEYLFGAYIAQWISAVSSFIFCVLSVGVGVYFLLQSKQNLSLCAIAVYIGFCFVAKLYYYLKKRKINVKSKS